jgi:membrane peptidoglycan carboxypeptidase
VLAGAVITGLAGPLALFTVGYLGLRVPDPADAVQPQQVALVSFADDSQLGPLVPAAGTRVTVPLERVPAHVRAAVLAALDPGFYRSAGLDAITQQYLRQARRTDDAESPWRRFADLVLNVKISQQRSKDEILADYLNSAYFGRGSYGIQAAAQAYFGKDVTDLTTSEGALLAGLLQAPAGSDPAQHPDRAAQRWNAVLDGMTAEGWLDRGARAAQQLPQTAPRRPVTVGVPADSTGHVVAAVAAELTGLGISERELSGGGLRITTTLDPRRQQQAVRSARGAPDQRAGAPRSAMVAIDPGTGGVLAYYGGDDGRGTDYARAQRQAGPTFTPFVVLARLLGGPKAGKKVEPGAVAAAARAAGISAAASDGKDRVSAVDLASAYATFAADGVWRPPHLVASVSTADGRVLYRAAPRAERRFAPQVARTVTATMREGAGQDGLALPGGRPVAARTGTVESEPDAAPPDAWMAGFTPELATSVWVGTDRNAPARTRSAWREFMTEALSEPPAPERGPDPATGTPDPDVTEAAGPATTPTTTPPPSAGGPSTTTGTSRPARPPGRPTARPPASSTADDPTTSARSSPRTTTDRPDPDDADETDEPDEPDEPSATPGQRTTDRDRPADESG